MPNPKMIENRDVPDNKHPSRLQLHEERHHALSHGPGSDLPKY
jgi:hypothetical protein